jgi:hypothetical protein
LLGGHKALDDAVLQGVVAQNHETSARPEQDERGGETGLEVRQLVVDGNTEGLKDARGRMSAASLWRRHSPLNQRCELLGRVHRRMAPSLHDRPRDPSGERLLAMAAEEHRKFACFHRREQVGRGTASGYVEAHVETSAGPEPEAALHIGQLVARQTEI